MRVIKLGLTFKYVKMSYSFAQVQNLRLQNVIFPLALVFHHPNNPIPVFLHEEGSTCCTFC